MVSPAARAARRVPRSVAALLGAAALAATGVVIPSSAAHAAVTCDVTYRVRTWQEGPAGGGFYADIRIEHLGDPVSGWTLAFDLPGHTLRHGWGAAWSGHAGEFTAVGRPWNADLGNRDSAWIGLVGGWTGEPAEPASFRLNGVACTGTGPPQNRPPTVTLTSPQPGDFATLPGTLRLAAEAADPDGAVEAVEFFVDETLVGTDAEAPYEVTVPTSSIGFGRLNAWARAVDDGSPPLTADSERVPFSLLTIPPLSLVAEPTSLTVVAGGSTSFTLRLSSAGADAEVALEVAGAAGVTVTPTSVTFNLEHLTEEITVTAAPGTGGGVATITAAADPSQVVGSAQVTVVVTEDTETPGAGATGPRGTGRHIGPI